MRLNIPLLRCANGCFYNILRNLEKGVMGRVVFYECRVGYRNCTVFMKVGEGKKKQQLILCSIIFVEFLD